MWALQIWLLFKLLALITFYSNMVQPQNFLGLLIIYLALHHCLQNPNITFQYWDMSHQMTWYILAHMPYFRKPGHLRYHNSFYCDSFFSCCLSKLQNMLISMTSVVMVLSRVHNIQYYELLVLLHTIFYSKYNIIFLPQIISLTFIVALCIVVF